MASVERERCTFPVQVTIHDPEGRKRTAYLREGESGPVRIGRAPENDLQIVSPYISRRHAEIWPHENGILFEDLASTSGSYVDGERVDKVLVTPNQSVWLGSPDGLRLTVRSEEEDEDLKATRPSKQTEVLRVADLAESRYLTSTDRLFAKPEFQSSNRNDKVAERLLALISLISDLLVVTDPADMSEKLLSRILALLPVDRGMVLLHNEETQDLVPAAWQLREDSEVVQSEVRRGPRTLDGEDLTASQPVMIQPEVPFLPIQTVTNRVFREGVGLLSLDAARDQRLEGSKSVLLQSVRSIMAAPIASAKKVYGVIYVDTHRTMRKDDEDILEWLVAVAHQAGMLMDKLSLLEQRQRMMESMMKGLAASIDARDGLTAGHSARVAHYSVGVAKELELSVEDQYAIYYAALLHDYGKIGIDDAVLKKPAGLTREEFDHIKLHAKFTYDILSKIDFPPELADLPMMAASHHERWDGKGYPWALAQEDIPLAGRIIAIADVYDSLTRKRHYRDPMPQDEVLAYLEEGRGGHFDPRVLDAFFSYHQDTLEVKEQRRESKRRRQAGLDEPTSPGEVPPNGSNEPETPSGRARALAGPNVTEGEEGEEPTVRIEADG